MKEKIKKQSQKVKRGRKDRKSHGNRSFNPQNLLSLGEFLHATARGFTVTAATLFNRRRSL